MTGRSTESLANSGWQRPALYLVFALAVLTLQYVYWFSPWGARFAIVSHWAGFFSATALQTVGLALVLLATIRAVRLPVAARRGSPLVLATILLILAFVLPLLTSWIVLDRFANSGDEFAYLFQARQFVEGKLWDDPPPLGNALVATRTWIYGGKWISQYLPGWSLILALGKLAAIPYWALNPLLGFLSTADLLWIMWRWSEPAVALWLAALYALSAFFLFNAASYFPHVATAMLILGFVVAGRRYLERNREGDALLVGMALGGVGIIRPYDALWMGLLFAVWAVSARRRILRSDGLIALAGLPFLILLLVYQQLVMGGFFTSTYSVAGGQQIRAEVSYGSIGVLARLGQELVVWTSPALVMLYLGAFWVKLRARRLAFYDLVAPILVVAYFVQGWLGGNRYGPRYYFDFFPIMFLTMATAWPLTLARLRRLAAEVAGLGLIYTLMPLPFIAVFFHTIVWERQDVFRQAEQRGLKNAVVMIATDAGVLLPMPLLDLPRNEPGMNADILYANGKVADAQALRRTFPGRTIWLYERAPDDPVGELRPQG